MCTMFKFRIRDPLVIRFVRPNSERKLRGAGARATSVSATSNGAEVVGRPVEPRQPSGLYVSRCIARSGIIYECRGEKETERGRERERERDLTGHTCAVFSLRNENESTGEGAVAAASTRTCVYRV